MTQNFLSRQLLLQVQNETIKEHFKSGHNWKPTHKLLSMNTKIIDTKNITSKLLIKEAILIKKLNTSFNRQLEKFENTLKLQPFRNELISQSKPLGKKIT